MIEAGIRTYVLADTNISSAIGDRFAWGRVPQETPMPYVRANVVSDVTQRHLTGNVGIVERSIQLSVFAGTFAQAAQLRDLIINRLDDYHGTLNTVEVLWVKHDNTRSFIEDGENLGVHHMAIDFEIFMRGR